VRACIRKYVLRAAVSLSLAVYVYVGALLLFFLRRQDGSSS
jgi:hypothetical protein